MIYIFGPVKITSLPGQWQFQVPVYLGNLDCDDIRVELYADAIEDHPSVCNILTAEAEIAGAVNGFVYTVSIDNTRPAEHFTPRIVAANSDILIPLEVDLIHWQH
jgi:starch phosphorylase